jgi:murein DD-endopeptidase MepM/ murein hydrolase activator NlpD
MLDMEQTPADEDQYFSIRKKHFFIWFLIIFFSSIVVLRYLFLNGFYIGFTPPPQLPAPLNQELISRFNQLEDKLNKTINDVNEVYKYKETLEKKLPVIDKSKSNKDGKGGVYLPLNKINLAVDDYEIQGSFDKLDLSLESISEAAPMLKKFLSQALLLQTNLPDGIPLIGTYVISSGFGDRQDPFTTQNSHHPGVDLATEAGTPVVAAIKGKVSKVVFSKEKTGYGNFIEITHAKEVVTLYGHLSEIFVKENQILQKGELIGLVGDTGRSTAPHLHFEVLVAGKQVDPMGVISPIAMKPNPIALSAVNAEVRAKCAPLLLIVKDENAKLFKDCLESKGKNVKDVLIAKQAEAASPIKELEKPQLRDGCSFIDSNMRLQVDTTSPACQSNPISP